MQNKVINETTVLSECEKAPGLCLSWDETESRAQGPLCKSLGVLLYCTPSILDFQMWWFRMDKHFFPPKLKCKNWSILWTTSLIINRVQVFLFLTTCSDIGNYIWLAWNEHAERYMCSTVFPVHCTSKIFLQYSFLWLRTMKGKNWCRTAGLFFLLFKNLAFKVQVLRLIKQS